MHGLPHPLRRVAAGVAVVLVCAGAAACGGGNHDVSTNATTSAPQSCGDQLVAWTNRADVKAAVASGKDLSGAPKDDLSAIDRRCSKELDAMSDADAQRYVDRMDPDVAAYLAKAGTKSTFEKTGHAITDG